MFRLRYFGICLLLAFSLNTRAANTNILVWHKAANRVDADIRGMTLWPLLEKIATDAHWKIYVEPGITRNVSTKFKNLPSGEALKMLLGDLNFALVPQTNAPANLYVFTSTMQNATQLVGAGKSAKHVPNELLVRVKPGTDIEALAKLVGAKIVGRIDKLGIYLFQFADATAAEAALALLQNDSDVLAVGYNYYFEPDPSSPRATATAPLPPVPLTLDPPSQGPCKVVIGLIDTRLDTPDPSLASFLMKSFSVVGGANANSSEQAQSLSTIPLTQFSNPAVPTHADSMFQSLARAVSQSSGGHTSARVIAVNVYGASETTTTWNVALGIQAAVNNGANVLNLSLGSSGDSLILDSILRDAIADGILVFAAAGNTPVNTPTYPAALPGVNAVTALQQPGVIAPYANYGDFIDLALPGASVVYFGNQPYMV
ncbi:MAG: S8 family serine peptidase, partial [Limisphaerales bacterium]